MKKPLSILSLLFLLLLTIPAAQAQEALTQTLTAPDNSFSMMYPAGWTVSEQNDGSALFVSRTGMNVNFGNLMMQGAPAFEPGDTSVLFSPTTGDMPYNLSDSASYIALIYGKTMDRGDIALDELTVGNFPAVRAVVAKADSHYDIEVIALDFGSDQIGYVVGMAAKGELAALEPTLLAMVESLQMPASSGASASGQATATVKTTATVETIPTVGTEEALPPIVTSTSSGGEYTDSVSVPDNWSAKALSLSSGADIALLEGSPNHIGGDVKFPASSRGGSTPQEVANTFTTFITGTITEIEVNGRPAARLDGTSNDSIELYIVVTTSAGDFALISFYGPADAMAEEEPTLLAMAASVTTGDPAAAAAATPVPTAVVTVIQNAAPTATTVTAAAGNCTVTAGQGANLRSGPGTEFARAGALAAGVSQSVTGQANGSDGFVWWKLESGSWVRSDLVQTGGDCTAVPTVAA